jgi:nitrile hydratase
MGGMQGFGPVVVPGGAEVYHERWEPRVFAMSTVVGSDGLGRGSGRALRETLPPEEYLRMTYYERWLWSTEQRLLRKGTIEPGEVDGWVARLRAADDPPRRTDPDQARRVVDAVCRADKPLAPATDPRFAVGDRVTVKRMRPAGHTRCPRYVRGVTGVVDRVHGVDAFPDIGPYEGPAEPVYGIAFCSDHLFGPGAGGAWTVLLDLFESYLETA